MKIVYVSTFPPKICGIGSYTRDLIIGMESLSRGAVQRVVAIDAPGESFDYGPEVVYQFEKDKVANFIKAAKFLSQSDFDVVSLQHEYGLYGGEMGNFVLHLTGGLKKPLVSTIHMVSVEPTPDQKEVTRRIITDSQLIAVMTERSKRDLKQRHQPMGNKVRVIPHGAPDVPYGQTDLVKKKLGLAGKKVLTAVNIIRSSRGVDLAIKALGNILKKFPEVVYLIIGPDPAGQKGPNPYRLELIELVDKMGLRDQVVFKDRYLPLEEVMDYIQAADIFLTPYRPPEESSSGSLAYAVAAGKVCLSTPFGYAKEVLGGGRGKIVPWEDEGAIAETVIDLFSNPEAMEEMARKTYRYGRKMTWEKVAEKYWLTFKKAIEKNG